MKMVDEMVQIKRFKVGGAVRDLVRGKIPNDVDWVVVGMTPEGMKARGFTPVGKDFPVFLHPKTKEEHALARTERKSGKGHTGFSVDFNPTVSLEEDLERRDLTINAMALDEEGNLVDPFNGLQDVERKILRHVGPAFRDDPLRVLRVARFAAQLDFLVHPATLKLMEDMVNDGELEHLTAERVWKETEKALLSNKPSTFFHVLQSVGALKVVFPELHALVGVEQNAEHHPEGDVWTHTMMVLDMATELTPDPLVRFAALVHDLGKAVSHENEENGPGQHKGHEEAGVAIVKSMAERLAIPAALRNFGALVSELHLNHHKSLEMKPGKVVKLLNRLKVRHSLDTLERFILACEADARGRGADLKNRPLPQGPFLLMAAVAARQVNVRPGVTGKKAGELLFMDMAEAVRRVKKHFNWRA